METPVETTPVATDGFDNLRAELDKAMQAEGIEFAKPKEPKPEAATTTPTTEEPKQETATVPDKPAEAQTQDKVGEPSADKPKLSRFEKEKQRAKTQWDEIKAEKDKLAAERAEIERRKAEIEATRKQESAQEPQFTSEDYTKFADLSEAEATKLEADGKYEEADQKRALARLARQNADAAQHQARQPSEMTVEQLEHAWRKSYVTAAQEIPELTEKDSPMRSGLIGGLKVLGLDHPDVPAMGAKFLKAALEAGGYTKRLADMTEENNRLTARLKELEQATSLNGAGDALKVPVKRLEDMTIEELETDLKTAIASSRGG